MQQLPEGLKTSGGGSNADDREGILRGLFSRRSRFGDAIGLSGALHKGASFWSVERALALNTESTFSLCTAHAEELPQAQDLQNYVALPRYRKPERSWRAFPLPQPISSDESIKSLFGRITEGDRQAFAALFDGLAPTVLGLLVRILRCQSLAEEVLEEVFLQVWKQAGLYRPESGSAQGWLFLMARSCAVDRLKAARTAQPLVRSLPQEKGQTRLVTPQAQGLRQVR